MRDQGLKVVLRFTYRPRAARRSKTRILAHLDQLEPTLQDNSDISVMQAGFIGHGASGMARPTGSTTMLRVRPSSCRCSMRCPHRAWSGALSLATTFDLSRTH